MKKLKKLTTAALAAAMLLSAMPTAGAEYTKEETKDADVLYTLGLVQGSDKGYELYRQPTRAEALVMAVRLAGGESDDTEYIHPFTDIPQWADKHAGYAYAAGIAHGTADGIYGFDQPVSERDYATLMLRVLGYSDEDGDFIWEHSTDFAARMGIKSADKDGTFTRADMFAMTCDALSARMKHGTETVLELLAAAGAVDGAAANALGFKVGGELSGVEIYELCSNAVFSMEFYSSATTYGLDMVSATASGFFISPDGVAVSNYHAFDGNAIAEVVLNNGERYRVSKILSFDKDTDLVVFRVGKNTVDMKLNRHFPYLEYIHSDNVRNGETVYAIGSPLNLSGTITSGIVSYKNRIVEGFANPMIQNTAAISQGNSGGVLVNAYGKAIGTTCAYFISGHSLNLAIPLDILFELDFSAPGCTIAEMNKLVADAELPPEEFEEEPEEELEEEVEEELEEVPEETQEEAYEEES